MIRAATKLRAVSTAAAALPAAVISLLISSEPAYADLKLCNRMSYVVEAAIGIDDKSATATRGWFRIDPAACRVVAQGTLAADRILLHARALGVYGSSPIPLKSAWSLKASSAPRSHNTGFSLNSVSILKRGSETMTVSSWCKPAVTVL